MSSASDELGTVELCRLMNTTRQKVAELLKGSGLHIRERANGLVITNRRDPEKGQIHVAYADGQVCLERVTWDYWGELEGLGGSDVKVSAEKIISTLTGRI